MAVSYTLELFPNESVWNKLAEYMGGTEIIRTNENAGVDLFCVEDKDCPIGQVTLLDLGVKARMLDASGKPCHYWLAPRSSIWKNGVTQANSIGIIDSSYRGSLMGAVLPFQFQTAVIKDGARLFQVLAPDMGYISKVVFRHQSDLDVTARGSGGFGSTGLNIPLAMESTNSPSAVSSTGLEGHPSLPNLLNSGLTVGFIPTLSAKPAKIAEDLDV